jgi:hypothetical protein
MFRSQRPFTISIGKPGNGNYADTRLVVTTVARSETNTPSGLHLLVMSCTRKQGYPYLTRLRLCNGILECVHALLGSYGIRSGQHLDESMALILVDNTRLDSTESSKDAPDLTFCSASTAYK